MARILARFRDDDLRAVIATGQLQRAEDERALFLILNRRRMAILRRYLTRLSPIADVQVTPEGVCAIDLARRAGIDARFRYHAELTQGERAMVVPVAVRDEGAICMPIVSTAPAQGPAADHPSRYRVLRIDNGVARGPLEAHFYDLGPRRGLMLVGLVRP